MEATSTVLQSAQSRTAEGGDSTLTLVKHPHSPVHCNTGCQEEVSPPPTH